MKDRDPWGDIDDHVKWNKDNPNRLWYTSEEADKIYSDYLSVTTGNAPGNLQERIYVPMPLALPLQPNELPWEGLKRLRVVAEGSRAVLARQLPTLAAKLADEQQVALLKAEISLWEGKK